VSSRPTRPPPDGPPAGRGAGSVRASDHGPYDGTGDRSPGRADARSATVALPVLLGLAGPHIDQVRRWTEGVLGWQPVDGEADPLVPAAVRLLDVAAAVDLGVTAVPTVLLVAETDDPAAAATATVAVRPDLALAWPGSRDLLAEVVADLLAVTAPSAAGPSLHVGGASGGVGTSTVALALAGLSAWRYRPTLAIVRGSAPVAEALAVTTDALSAPDLWQRATAVPGVPEARVVRVVDRAPAAEREVGGAPFVVHDAGVATDVDLLVCRPDRAGLAAIGATTAAAIVVVGDGPAPASAVARACGPRRRVTLAWSARVARAGLPGRIPAGLPGAWLRVLAPLVPRPPRP
jgi:hypothetical protein